jgi:4-hydroxy-3-polyprenylbenzoate decarboxylase
MLSSPAQIVINTETPLKIPSQPDKIQALLSERYHAQAGQLQVFGRQAWFSPVASGSNAARAMVVCPCSNGTLAAIAHGLSRSLIERAADVSLKEQKKLILVHRETPLSAIQLENMLTLARLGVVIMPASPAFYQRPTEILQLVDFIVARVLDHLNIAHTIPRWAD